MNDRRVVRLSLVYEALGAYGLGTTRSGGEGTLPNGISVQVLVNTTGTVCLYVHDPSDPPRGERWPTVEVRYDRAADALVVPVLTATLTELSGRRG